jgi:hypothetical protein
MRTRFALLLGAAALAAAAIPSVAMAGTPVDQVFQCRAGSFLVGFQGHIGAWIDQFQPVCAPWNPTARKVDPVYYGDVFGNVKGGGAAVTTAICTPGTAVVSIAWGLALPNGGPGHVQNLKVTCGVAQAPASIDGFHPEMTSDSGSNVSIHYGGACSPGLVANNLTISLDGTNISGLRLECDTPANIMAAAGPAHPLPLPGGGGASPTPAPGPHPFSLLPHHLPGGVVPPPPPPPPPPILGSPIVHGSWKTSEGAMTFQQDGDELDGFYTPDSGRIVAHRQGPNWTGLWSESAANHRCDDTRMGSHYWGRMTFTFTDQNRHFEGVWTYCSAPIASGKPWTGDRIK